MSAGLRAATTFMRIALKRRLNADYEPVAARRRFVKQRLTGPTTEAGGICFEQRGLQNAPNTILYVHGGGFIFGIDDTHRRFVDLLCHRTNSRGWIIDYRLAPEHPFPAARDDTEAALDHILTSAGVGRITVAADSAGGALALSAALSHRGSIRQVDRLVLMSPLTDCAMTALSYVYNSRRDPLFGPEAIIHKAHHYLGGSSPADPSASPLWADLQGLPPMQIFVGSTEVMLEDSTRLADKARAAGCDVELNVIPHAPHVFPLLVPWSAEASRALDAMTEFIVGDRTNSTVPR